MTTYLPLALLSALVITAQTAPAQNMLGLGLTNHSGVHGVLLNPARLANHPQRFSLNLVTAGAHLGNSFGSYQGPFSLPRLALGKVPGNFQTSEKEVDFLPEYVAEISGDALRSGSVSADVRGPSVLFTPRYGGGFSISTRIRSVSNSAMPRRRFFRWFARDWITRLWGVQVRLPTKSLPSTPTPTAKWPWLTGAKSGHGVSTSQARG